MAETTLKRGAVTALTVTDALANGVAASSDAFGLGTDAGNGAEEYRIVVTATAGTAIAAGETVDFYVAQGNAAGTYDGGFAVSQASVDTAALPNVNYIGSVVGDGTLTTLQTHGIARITGANAMVILHNQSATATTGTTASVQPLTYEST